MKLLLDTHILLWWLENDSRLPPSARDAIADRSNEVLVSVASLWEIVIKVKTRKLYAEIGEIDGRIELEGFGRLAIEASHLAALAILPVHHRDPFDHLLLAQAVSEGAKIVSVNRIFRAYPVDLF